MSTIAYVAHPFIKPEYRDVAANAAAQMLIALAARGELGAKTGRAVAETVIAAFTGIDGAPEETPK